VITTPRDDGAQTLYYPIRPDVYARATAGNAASSGPDKEEAVVSRCC